MTTRRRPTATSAFGVGRRENHDATAFYRRFRAPVLSDDQTVQRDEALFDHLHHGDARHMTDEQVLDGSVALMVTSPPYFAGKEYEEAVGEGHVPASYGDYLDMLHDVFERCVAKLEPGGRMAVNVANLGRKPFRSLASDVTRILEDLGLLLRGEIIWQKAEAAGGSCAWGSFQSAANPVLRDLTERVVVASKGRFDRAVSRPQRAARGLPHVDTLPRDDFIEATTDVWRVSPESAVRVGHPAPFPVALPARLIHLYTYEGDLVLDPFMGSGSTAVAALRTGRHYVGFDTDGEYVTAARKRLAGERRRLASPPPDDVIPRRVRIPARPATNGNGDASKGAQATDAAPGDGAGDDHAAAAVRQGQQAKEIARAVLVDCGFGDVRAGRKLAGGVEVNFVALDHRGDEWLFDVSGTFTSVRPGLRRTDTLWKALGKAAVIASVSVDRPPRLVLLTTDLPPQGSAGEQALRACRGTVLWDALELFSRRHLERLRQYALGAEAPIDDLLPGSVADDP